MSSLVRACLLVILLAGCSSAFSAGNYRKPPVTFEWRGPEVGGQPVVARVSGHRVAFGSSGTVREISGGNPPAPLLRFVGARHHVWPRISRATSRQRQLFHGLTSGALANRRAAFQKIKYADLYPGIDLIYYGNHNRLEYDLVVAPGASWRSIRLRLAAARMSKSTGRAI